MAKSGRAAGQPARSPRAASVPVAASAALAAAMLVCYLLLAPHATADGDAGELTLVLVTGGVAHPTGYPLYTMLGHVFVAGLRALGAGYAYAANAWAAVGGALALFLLHRVALRLLPAGAPRGAATRGAVAALPLAALGFNPQWIAECTLVEVNSWHVAWVCGAALLFVTIVQELERDPRAFRLAPRMLAWGFLCGAGGAHHRTAVFFAGAFSAAIVWALVRARRWRAWVPALWLAAGLVPMTSYLYLFVRARHPGASAVWPGLDPTWRGFYDHVSGAIYRGFLGSWRPDPLQLAAVTRDVYPFLWPGLLALAGWIAFSKRASERAVLAALLGGALLQLAFVYRYGVADPGSYFLPPLAMALLGLVGVARAALANPRAERALAVACGAIAVALGAWGTRAGLAQRRDVVHYDSVIRSMWHAVPDRPSIFLWASDTYYKVRLYQALEGDHGSVAIYNTAMLCQPGPQERFRRRYGFDPLANNGPEHAREFVAPQYIPEHHVLLDDRFLGRVNETIADSARVPVLMFNSTEMRLRKLNGIGG